MLLPPRSHSIREAGDFRGQAESDVLNLDQNLLPSSLQQKVDATVMVGDFGPDIIAGELSDGPGAQSLFDHSICPMRLSIDPTAVDFDEFEGLGEFAQRVGRHRDQDAMTGDGTLQHAAGIRGMSNDDAAVVKFDIGKKTLVASQETTRIQGGGELHAVSLT